MANPEFRKTLLIGLGGAGQQVVLRTKRFFMDTYGVLPPSIKLLCLDTDDEALKLRSALRDTECAIEPQEFLHLRVSEPSKFISATPVVNQWYVKPVPVGAITHGAGAVRQNGRLALFYHIIEVRRRIDQLLASLNDPQLETRMNTARNRLGSNTDFNLSRRETEIYVCGSVAGGTGSGTFLDIGLLLRHLCPNALIHGFFLLPWVYRNMAFAYRVFQNAYAALAELDNLQSIMFGDRHFIPYSIEYGDLKVEARKAPYDLFHVVDARNDYGQNIDDVPALCETIANALFLSIGAMSYPVQSVTDNLLSHINVAPPRVWDGRYARYSSVGVSSIHYPVPELHRLLAAQNALALCTAAIRQLEAGESAQDAAAARQRIEQEVDSFINQLNLHRPHVRARLCPDQSPVAITVENFDIADAGFPALLTAKFDGEKRSLQQTLQAVFESQGQPFTDDLRQSLDRRLKALAENPRVDSATRHQWAARLTSHLQSLLDETAQELVQAEKQVLDLQQSADARLEIAEKSRYLPLLGGSRKRAAQLWAEDAGKLLTTLKTQIQLGHEKQCYETLLELVRNAAAIAVPTPSDIVKALIEAESELRGLAAKAEKNLEILRNRPNHVLLGYGNVVVVKNRTARELYDPAMALPYEQFTQEADIYSSEVYLQRHRQGPHALAELFHAFCRRKLDFIQEVTVDGALETLAQETSDPQNFVKQQFDHLFRLASALWDYDRGRITPERAEQMDKIINLGFRDHEEALSRYEQVTEDAKARFSIRSRLAYSSTGDPYHIWLLNYAAAIPAYFLSGLHEARDAYHEQITPTYHVDAYFEMNVPDLFPVSDIDNRALRALGMAIVSGIDVIHDEKLPKGHKFTWDHQAIRGLNYGEPKVWGLFRDMYAEVKENTDNLYHLLVAQLRDRVTAMDQGELRNLIEAHITKVRKKLDERNFSRLISARLTYREIRALEDFLAKPPFGYAMNFDDYLAGKLG